MRWVGWERVKHREDTLFASLNIQGKGNFALLPFFPSTSAGPTDVGLYCPVVFRKAECNCVHICLHWVLGCCQHVAVHLLL